MLPIPDRRAPGSGWGPRAECGPPTPLLKEMLAFAYNVRDYQFVGAPGWVASTRYDVVLTPDRAESALGTDPALAATLGSEGRNQQRLRAVLLDRVGLVLRAETRELPIYALVQARNGAKLSVHPADGPRGVSLGQNGRGHLVAVDMSIKMLADRFLSFEMGRPVVDETGLSGEYDFKLDWSPDLDVPAGQPAEVPGNPSQAEAPIKGASQDESIFTALTRQLGLRLESKKGPVQVYVVEKIERPTEN
jgi:uncharacterized protein (TIGR03435 family)